MKMVDLDPDFELVTFPWIGHVCAENNFPVALQDWFRFNFFVFFEWFRLSYYLDLMNKHTHQKKK